MRLKITFNICKFRSRWLRLYYFMYSLSTKVQHDTLQTFLAFVSRYWLDVKINIYPTNYKILVKFAVRCSLVSCCSIDHCIPAACIDIINKHGSVTRLFTVTFILFKCRILCFRLFTRFYVSLCLVNVTLDEQILKKFRVCFLIQSYVET
jgi:hypothetical protein